MRSAECPLLAQSGHRTHDDECPLLGVKRTSLHCSTFTPDHVFRETQKTARGVSFS